MQPAKPAAAAKKLTVEQQREEYSRALRQTYAHGAKTAEPADAFSEWEKKQTPENVPVFTPPAAPAPEPKAEPAPQPVAEAAPAAESGAKTRVTIDDMEMEFSLEDILNEFK